MIRQRYPSLFIPNISKPPFSKVFFVRPGDIVRASLSSKKFKEKMPILISNIDLIKKSRSRYLNLVEIRQACKLTRNDIQDRYDCHFGTFDQEGTWQCDVALPGPGSYFLQIIFVSVEEFMKSPTITIQGRYKFIPLFSISPSFFERETKI